MPMSTCHLTVACDTSRPLLLTHLSLSNLPKGVELPLSDVSRMFLPQGREDKASECRVGLLVALTHVGHAR